MKVKDLIQLRLFNQGLTAAEFNSAPEVVKHFGAMQAQDYGMVKWAVGMRMAKPSEVEIERGINSGKIIRTHIIRPTWHLVHNHDIRWMMTLSAPYVKKAMQYVDKQVGLTGPLFKKALSIIEYELSLEDNLTKEELMSKLARKKLVVSNLLATQIFIHAELEMRICNGTRKGKKNTYSLFDNRVGPSEKLTKEESLIKLATLYFKSRGPATIKDFMWWSGMSLMDARLGVDGLGKKLLRASVNGLEFLYFELENSPSKKVSALLPAYDEFMVSYSEGRDLAFPHSIDKSILGNGVFKALVLQDNNIVGSWKKIVQKPGIEFDFLPGYKINSHLRAKVDALKSFLGTG